MSTATAERGELSDAKRRLLQKYLQGDGQRSRAGMGSIGRRPPASAIPLSHGQQQIWLHCQLAPELPLYNELLAVRRTGPLDVPALEQSLGEILRRHEAWRTTFDTVHGEPVQVISPPPTISLPVIDLRDLPEAEREPAALRLAAEETRRPLDLVRGPLLNAKLVRLADAEHRLYVTLHQILFDGVSAFSVFLPELATLYEAFTAGKASPLPEPPIQYGDFAHWERRRFQGDLSSAQLDYWRRQLAGAPTTLELPTDRRRPAIQTFRGAHAPFALPEGLSESLTMMSQRERVTLFTTLLAAFNTLLYRYTGQEDILVGTLASSRKWPEVEGLLGVFMNTLVIRTRLSPDLSFRRLLSSAREVTLEALGHGDVPFPLLVKELQPERDPSRNPLFQAMLVLEPPSASQSPGWSLTQMDVDTGVARLDLHFQLDERPQGIIGRIRYSSDLFDDATVVRMATHFTALLEGVARNPDLPLSAIPMLTASERLGAPLHRELVRPCNPFVAFEQDEVEQSIPRRFEKQVTRHRHRIAIRTGRAEWTYEALNQAADRVAHALSTVVPDVDGARVALLLDHDAPMVAGILGVLKAGAAYVPLDPTHPRERLAQILQDSRATAMLTSTAHLPLAAELATHSVRMFEIDDILRRPMAPEYGHTASPDHLAYLLYTSGSTGRPKGVAQNHRNVLHFIAAYTNNLHLGADDALTLISSYSVDAAVMDIFGALLNGATLCPIDIRDVGLPGLCERLRGDGVTVYHSTPTLYRHVVRALATRPTLRGVRLVVLGGEEVRGEDVEAYQERFGPDCLFVNGFGPTESTVSLQYFIDKRAKGGWRSVPIGYPVERTAVSLLSRDGHPDQVYGEIAIRSPHVALGYWQRPDLTCAAFFPGPAGGKDRIYRTGDTGRLLPDGSVEFCGRKDAQVKIHGFRVELGEIEAALSQHPAVKEAAAVVGEAADEKRVVAYWVADGQPAPSTDALRAFLGQRLPGHMIPSAFARVDALPLTPSGKLDRRALPVPDQADREPGFTAPRDDLERALGEIWKSLLGVERIGVRDNFFDLGGHSLLGIRMFAEIENRLGVSLPLATLVKAPTVERLADVLRRDGDPAPCRPLVAIQPGGSRPPLFCVHGHSGEVLFYRDLSRRLGPDQPFFALQAQGLTGKPAHPTIQAMAADYLQEIRSVQPRGPYAIGGYCFGAIVAFEMAQQVLARGEAVALLALFLGRARTPPPADRVRLHLERLRPLGTGARLAYVLERAYRNPVAARTSAWLWRLGYALWGRRARPSSRLLRNVPEMNLHAARRYVPRTYEGRMTVFVSGDLDPKRDLAGMTAHDVDVVRVPGDRDSMLREPFVEVLAQRLDACLGRTRQGT